MPKTREILKQVKKLELKTKKLVDGLLFGAYHSIFKGRGIEFSEVREYAFGDDVRTIDWNVTARMNHPYVKEFIEERDLNVVVVFDVSASSEFGSTKEKKEAAIELAASLMFAAMRNNDNVGLALFTDRVERFIPLRKGKRHILKLIRQLVYYEPESRTSDLKESLIFISKILRKRSIIFIISDFIFKHNYMKPLKILRNRHDVIAININDVREKEIPDVGYIELEDSETGEQVLVNTSDESFRKQYVRLVRERNRKFEREMKRVKVDYMRILSDEPYEVPIRNFFRLRMKRLLR